MEINYGTMEKKYDTKNFGTLNYYEKKIWYYGKNYGTVVNYTKLLVLTL